MLVGDTAQGRCMSLPPVPRSFIHRTTLLSSSSSGRDRINIVSIVGGLSDTKQERLLGRKPEIVVATVGRLWEMITSNEAHLRDMGRLRFFVLDEADR